jgi:hypothetical protein
VYQLKMGSPRAYGSALQPIDHHRNFGMAGKEDDGPLDQTARDQKGKLGNPAHVAHAAIEQNALPIGIRNVG